MRILARLIIYLVAMPIIAFCTAVIYRLAQVKNVNSVEDYFNSDLPMATGFSLVLMWTISFGIALFIARVLDKLILPQQEPDIHIRTDKNIVQTIENEVAKKPQQDEG